MGNINYSVAVMDERGKQPENTQGAGGLTVKSSPEIIIIIIIRQVRLLQCLLSRHNFNIHTPTHIVLSVGV